MNVSEKRLQSMLVDSGIITKSDFEQALSEAKINNEKVEDVIISKNLITADQLGQIVADDFGFDYINLGKKKIPEDVLKMIPQQVAEKQKIVAFAEDKKSVKVAMANPDNLEIIRLLKKSLGKEIRPYLALESDLQDALSGYKQSFKEEFSDLVNKDISKAISEATKTAKKGGKGVTDVPIIRLVNSLISYAYESRASDIHIEPHREGALIRYRIDGLLQDIINIPREVHELIVARIKVISRLRTDEHFAAQDGKFQQGLGGGRVDIRVSILPTSNGEKVVMRILSEKGRIFTLEDLGFSAENLELMKKSIQKPYGMILSTGPTGSGKTTTLYAILKILNTRDVNISTVEDPVEFDVEGINQVQVNPKTNLTFASGLRSLLRQDPDIIMVGEIRDNETAVMAVNAAMTGHLVLSTLHTNDAATTLPRFLDMDIEPFLIASTVNIIIAQRLVRKICNKCVTSYVMGGKELENFKKLISDAGLAHLVAGNKKDLVLFKGAGCQDCGNSGFKGRIGVFEVLEMRDNIRDLLMKHSNASELDTQAKKNGMKSMLEDGITKALNGVTTIEEVFRVVKA